MQAFRLFFHPLIFWLPTHHAPFYYTIAGERSTYRLTFRSLCKFTRYEYHSFILPYGIQQSSISNVGQENKKQV